MTLNGNHGMLRQLTYKAVRKNPHLLMRMKEIMEVSRLLPCQKTVFVNSVGLMKQKRHFAVADRRSAFLSQNLLRNYLTVRS